MIDEMQMKTGGEELPISGAVACAVSAEHVRPDALRTAHATTRRKSSYGRTRFSTCRL